MKNPPTNPEAPEKAWAPWMIQAEWRQGMENAVRTRCAANWLVWLHLGVMRYAVRDFVGAGQAWQTSLDLAPSAWAYRNLAVLAHDGEWFELHARRRAAEGNVSLDEALRERVRREVPPPAAIDFRMFETTCGALK